MRVCVNCCKKCLLIKQKNKNGAGCVIGISEGGVWMSDKKYKFSPKVLLVDFLAFLAGSACVSLSVNMFTAPNQIAPGGATGLATVINYLTGFPIGMGILVINIPLFLIAWKVFGWQFLAKTAVMTVMSSVFIDISAVFITPYSGDKLLASLFGGVLSGIGYGLVFIRGATSGGTDIIGMLIKRKFSHIPMGTLVMLLDMVIVGISGLVYRNMESMLYAVIVFFISGRVVNYLVYGAGNGKMILAVSNNGSEIAEKVISETRRGVTVIPVQGAYTGENKKMLVCVVRPSEVQKIYSIIRRCDKEAFVIITRADEILGFGFKQDDTGV